MDKGYIRELERYVDFSSWQRVLVSEVIKVNFCFVSARQKQYSRTFLSVGNILLRTQFIAERFVQLCNCKSSSGVIVYLLIVSTTYEREQII